ncbi:vomeronasal type-2 receptor 26-like [Pogona vitticeps]
MVTNNYQHILVLAFAVKEINGNPLLLPNLTLGFHIYDSYFNARSTYCATVLLTSTLERFAPNYLCDHEKNLIAVIGGLDAATSFHVATILDIYKIAQVGLECVSVWFEYGTSASFLLIYGPAPVMNDKTPGLFFYQMMPKESLQNAAMLSLLLHFRWTWIGVLVMDTDNGERFLQMALSLFFQSGVCVSNIEKIPMHVGKDLENWIIKNAKLYDVVMDSTANVWLVYGESYTLAFLRGFSYVSEIRDAIRKPKGKVWILTAQMELASVLYQNTWNMEIIHGILSFTMHSHHLPGFHAFIGSHTPSSSREDGFIRDFWQHAFSCVFPNLVTGEVEGKVCTGEERLDNFLGLFLETRVTGHSYSIYNAVYAVAHALHAMSLSRLKHHVTVNDESLKTPDEMLWQLHPFLRRVSFNNSAGEQVSFDENGELVAGLDVTNWIFYSNQSFSRTKVGWIDSQAPLDQLLTIHEEAIQWHRWFNQVQPLSVCTESCPPGSSKKVKEGEQFCCYDCIPCSEGTISEQKGSMSRTPFFSADAFLFPSCSDMIDCYACVDGKYPGRNKDLCIPKDVHFLFYGVPLGITLSCFALSFSLITAMVLGMFLKHHNTPIVKANNRGLTYTLLVSLMLSFLCVLLFIGQPQKVTCLLQQTTFGIIFSVAVSCVLAKTITVIVVFMATKPGSKMRKWVGKRLSTTIVTSCSLIQAGICTVWLATSPPFPDADMHSMIQEIILECNEGSVSMFYSVLGYMGFLAIVSFIAAFFARNLPDAFNEAKFITFSMLVFCSVWLSFIPAYLSTKGKYMVAVEILAILASSAGLLGCIFFPKCYIILLRPHLNKREQLTRIK